MQNANTKTARFVSLHFEFCMLHYELRSVHVTADAIRLRLRQRLLRFHPLRRACRVVGALQHRRDHPVVLLGICRLSLTAVQFCKPLQQLAERVTAQRAELTLLQIEDRKSTRLNSSHGYISYAVFCLKKKK